MHSLEPLFNPNGVAVIGSAGEGKIANVMIKRLIESGKERVYAVNPKAQGIGPIPGFTSVKGIGKPVDLVVIASPAASVASVIEDCGEAGVKAAIVISSGFSEAGNREGEEVVKAASAKYGIRFIGPNCAGLVNTRANLVTTLEVQPEGGRIALVSQSGAIGGLFMSLAVSQHTGISKFVSYGNGADIKVTELLSYLRDDADTDVIALYIESIRDGREFMAVMKSVTAVKPVVVIKSGRTSAGQRATMSHTGSMAGADAIFAAALDQCGAIRAGTLEELFDIAKGFTAARELSGKRLAIVTNSGGPGVMSTDKADEIGLLVQEVNEETKTALASFLPPHAGIHNPIDLTVEGSGAEYEKALTAMLKFDDSAIAIYVGTPYLKSIPVAEGIIGAVKKSGKPVFSVFDVGIDLAESLARFKMENIQVYPSGERAATALTAIHTYNTLREKIKKENPENYTLKHFEGENSAAMAEPLAMKLLNDHGIPSPVFASAASADEAAEKCGKIGYPVVMKVVSPQIIHKSDVGGVVLNIKNSDDAVRAFNQLAAVAVGKEFNGVIIYPMVRVDREVIMGLTHDVNFGPIVAFGLGGIYTEVFKDVVFRVAPVSRNTAKEMIQSIKSYRILEGIRGKAKADMDALAGILSDFSYLPIHHPEIVEADINPLSVSAEGIYALDARILRRTI